MALEWQGPDEQGIWRAFDQYAAYLVLEKGVNDFTVGYLPAPGPMIVWKKGITTLDVAMEEAEACSVAVQQFRQQE